MTCSILEELDRILYNYIITQPRKIVDRAACSPPPITLEENQYDSLQDEEASEKMSHESQGIFGTQDPDAPR